MCRGVTGQRCWLPSARSFPTAISVLGLMVVGCNGPRLDFSKIQRPERAPELDAYEIFVGDWNWTAEVVNAEGADRVWNGSAKWEWALDGRSLEGRMSARTKNAGFEAKGVWSWHPTRDEYIWWMFNDWGYPQQGKASYDAGDRRWRMKYRSVGLDGSRSYGRYIVHVVDKNTLDWRMEEWLDPFHLFKKIEMNGTYKRK